MLHQTPPISTDALLTLVLSGLLLLTAIYEGFTQWRGRDTHPVFMATAVILLASNFVAHAHFAFGWENAGVFLGVALIVPYTLEVLSLKTGFPFGSYHYTGHLGFNLPLGLPAYVALSWLLLLYCGLFVGQALAIIFPVLQNPIFQIILVSISLVITDSVMDPIAFRMEYWIWRRQGRWFGIPATNFFGWFFTATLSLTILSLFTEPLAMRPIPEPHWLYFIPVLMYGLLGLQFIGLLRKQSLAKLIPLTAIQGCVLIGLYVAVLLK